MIMILLNVSVVYSESNRLCVSCVSCVLGQCLTDAGSELTRVSLVDSSGSCILDELVQPGNKIRNFLTQ